MRRSLWVSVSCLGALLLAPAMSAGQTAPAGGSAARGETAAAAQPGEGARSAASRGTWVDLRFGAWRAPGVDVFGGVRGRWNLADNLALTFGMDGFGGGDRTAVIATPVGVQWAPWRSLVGGAIAPYLTIGGGPVAQFRHQEHMRATAMARAGGGVDFLPGRGRTSVGVNVAYDWMPSFQGLGGSNYSGVEVALNVGWARGRR